MPILAYRVIAYSKMFVHLWTASNLTKKYWNPQQKFSKSLVK